MVRACDVLAVGAHPDDVELGCGGIVARLAAAGRSVGVADLTAGEAGSRGDASTRADEAATAAGALGLAWRVCLGLPDGGLAAAEDGQLEAVVALIRAARPRIVLVPDEGDPHPDHAAAGVLTVRGSFFAGVSRWAPEAGAAHRPAALLAYAGPRQVLEPTLVVDVSAVYGAKRAALAAYRSQFDPTWTGPGAAAPLTHLSSPFFLAAIEGRDRAAGNLVGCEAAEALRAVQTLSADEVVWLLGSGS